MDTSSINGSGLPISLPKNSSTDKLERLEARLERIEAMLAKQAELLEQAPHIAATVGNIADSTVQNLQAKGIDVDERARAGLRVLERASDPEILSAIEDLLEHPKEVKTAINMMRQAPGTVAMAANVFDGWMTGAMEEGIDPTVAVHNTVESLHKLVLLMQSDEYSALMSSGVFDPETLQVIGRVGDAMQHAKHSKGQTGLLGAMRAASDPKVQRALHFAIELAKHFGESLDEPTKLPGK